MVDTCCRHNYNMIVPFLIIGASECDIASFYAHNSITVVHNVILYAGVQHVLFNILWYGYLNILAFSVSSPCFNVNVFICFEEEKKTFHNLIVKSLILTVIRAQTVGPSIAFILGHRSFIFCKTVSID